MYSIKIEHHEMITEPVVRVRHCDSMRTQVIPGQKGAARPFASAGEVRDSFETHDD